MLVTVDYVKARTGFKGMADDVLTAAIEDASNLVRAEVEPVLDDVDADSLEAAIAAATGTSGTTGAGVVRSVVVNMVRRGTRNPLGAVQETLGDYSRAMATDGGIPTIYLTHREANLVRKACRKSRLGSIPMRGYIPVQPSEREFGTEEQPA